jgi:hypothetical protein
MGSESITLQHRWNVEQTVAAASSGGRAKAATAETACSMQRAVGSVLLDNSCAKPLKSLDGTLPAAGQSTNSKVQTANNKEIYIFNSNKNGLPEEQDTFESEEDYLLAGEYQDTGDGVWPDDAPEAGIPAGQATAPAQRKALNSFGTPTRGRSGGRRRRQPITRCLRAAGSITMG